MLMFNSIYNVLKKEYWFYRYYFLFTILCFITFKLDTITASRIIRFLIVCLILILYKKIQNYLEARSYLNLYNIKYWMWIHAIINPLLYFVWKWDVYMYYKIIEFINNVFKNNTLKIFLIIILRNVSVPIKIIYLRFYTVLNMIKNLNFYEFMFNRIHGFIISVLIFSDIIQYLLLVTGGYLYLILNVYIILYIINVIYTVYYHFFKKFKKTINFNINIQLFQLFKDLTIYKIGLNYINILEDIEINEVYGFRVVTTIIGTYIKRHINEKTIIKIEIEKIPELWRSWINYNKIHYKNFLYISYLDDENMSKIAGLKMEHIFKKKFLNNNYKNFDKYHDTYLDAIHCLSELFELYESVLVYKYYVYKKGAKEVHKRGFLDLDVKYIINIEEYEYICKMYLLIVKNILYYIWSFEYYIFKNKNKLTKLHVIDEIYVDFGYHIYPKDKQNFTQYDQFHLLVWEENFPNDKVIPWNDKVYSVNEGLHVLLSFIELHNSDILIYINSLKNKELKKIVPLLNKYIEADKFCIFWNNPFANLKEEMAKEYFEELKSVMDDLYKEWEINYMSQENIFEKQVEILLKFIKHYKKGCSEL